MTKKKRKKKLQVLRRLWNLEHPMAILSDDGERVLLEVEDYHEAELYAKKHGYPGIHIVFRGTSPGLYYQVRRLMGRSGKNMEQFKGRKVSCGQTS